MKKKLFLIAALAVAAAVAAWYVLRMDQGDGMAYLTEPVTIGNITRTVNATGEVGAVQLVSVGAQVGGQIKKLHVVLGQDVKKGDLIAEIDSVPQLNQLETDKARLQSYESQLAAKKVALKTPKPSMTVRCSSRSATRPPRKASRTPRTPMPSPRPK